MYEKGMTYNEVNGKTGAGRRTNLDIFLLLRVEKS